MNECRKCGSKDTGDLIVHYRRIAKDGNTTEYKLCKSCNRDRLREPMRKYMARRYSTPEGKLAQKIASHKQHLKRRALMEAAK